MATEAEAREIAVEMRKVIADPSRARERPVWEGILQLLERSEFGKKEARSEVILRAQLSHAEATDDKLDGSFMRIHSYCHELLGSRGTVSMVPFSAGFDTQSASYCFKPKG